MRDEVRNQSALADQVDRLVGTVFSRSLFDLDLALQEGILHAIIISQRAFAFDPIAASEYVDALVDALYSDVVPSPVIVPLFAFDSAEPFDISPFVAIRQMTDGEISTLLNWGVLGDRADGVSLERVLPRTEQWCVAIDEPFPKTFGECRPDELRARLPAEEIAERFVAAMRLAVGGTVRRGTAVTLMPTSAMNPGGGSGGSFARQSVTVGDFGRPIVAADPAKAQSLFQALDSGAVRSDRSLQLAVRRFAGARSRIDTEDVVLDLSIAAEALWLRGESTENTQRIAIRAGLDARGLGFTPSSVRRFVARAYGIRSKLVHGSDIKKVHSLSGKPCDLPTFANDLERLLQGAIRSAVTERASATPLETGTASWTRCWTVISQAKSNDVPPDVFHFSGVWRLQA